MPVGQGRRKRFRLNTRGQATGPSSTCRGFQERPRGREARISLFFTVVQDTRASHSVNVNAIHCLGTRSHSNPVTRRSDKCQPVFVTPLWHGAHPQTARHCCCLFHSTQSASLTPFPPKQSRALPMVKSTLPPLSRLTSSRSSKFRPPPAYVTGIVLHSARRRTRSSSMPFCSPSLSAAWIRNSEQKGSRRRIDSTFVSEG
jgi:hypothetical protein